MTTLTFTGLPVQIIGKLYEKWFKDRIVGIDPDVLMRELNAQQTEMIHAIEGLANAYLIERDGVGWYKITIGGIDAYESAIEPSRVSKRMEQRKIVLQILHDIYKETPNKQIDNKELSEKSGIGDFFELSSVTYYLEAKGLVEIDTFLGQNFDIRLSPGGYQGYQTDAIDSSVEMVSAYRVLFQLENGLRKFVERKLRENFGSDWWEKGISRGILNRVDERRNEELKVGWTVTNTKSNMEYLSFEHLQQVITNNWKVFEPIFGEQSKIVFKLKELEILRNAIAHTRTLSDEGYHRLEMYAREIENLTP